MLPFARVDFNDLGSIVGWLLEQWWVWVIVGVIVLFFLVVWIMPAAKLKPAEQFASTGAEANDIALGFLQIYNLPSGPWNDPTASGLTEREKRGLVDQWGVATRQEWLANIERLVTDRRRRDLWVSYLAVRGEVGARLGREPKTKEWLQAVIEAGGDKRDAKTFIGSIEAIEAETRKVVGRKDFPADSYVTTLEGYAFGQAVALTTWGVALGHADIEEARSIIRRINVEARPLFSSWYEFGLSYTVGRVMHWSDGVLGDKTWDKFGASTANDFAAGVSAKRQGPWALLPWTL
ncbi:DUF1266 domain-containing protein [Microbacterium sp. NPDC055903]